MKSWAHQQTLVLKGICKIRVKEGERLASETGLVPQLCNFLRLCTHGSVSPGEALKSGF